MPTTATRLFLLRHGRVHADWRGRLYGCHDVPLAPEGEDEARRAAERLAGENLDAVVSSGLQRTEFGAALLRASRGLARMDDPDLREIERGAWVGLRPEEVPADGFKRWHAAPERERAPGGESLADVAARVLPRLAVHARLHPGGRIAIVAHSWVLRVAACHALGLPLGEAPRLVVPTGTVIVLDAEPEAWHAACAARPEESALRPVLAAWALDVPPPGGTGWFRGPRRSET